MLRVGLTGGLASGKSFVGQTLADLGCFWIEADKLGHRVLLPDGEAYDDVVKEFGTGTPESTLDLLLHAAMGNYQPVKTLVRTCFHQDGRLHHRYASRFPYREFRH